MQVPWLVLAPVGLKRRRHGVRTTGQTPAVEELDHPQEAEGEIPHRNPLFPGSSDTPCLFIKDNSKFNIKECAACGCQGILYVAAPGSFLHGDHVACSALHGTGVAAEGEPSVPPTRM